jgi:hypothetical protein
LPIFSIEKKEDDEFWINVSQMKNSTYDGCEDSPSGPKPECLIAVNKKVLKRDGCIDMLQNEDRICFYYGTRPKLDKFDASTFAPICGRTFFS